MSWNSCGSQAQFGTSWENLFGPFDVGCPDCSLTDEAHYIMGKLYMMELFHAAQCVKPSWFHAHQSFDDTAEAPSAVGEDPVATQPGWLMVARERELRR